MKNIFARVAMLALMVATLGACTQAPEGYTLKNGTYHYNVPTRPAGQQDMLAFAAEPIDTVRVGFIGLGMRGPGAVKRFTHIPATKVVALCDLNPKGVAESQAYLAAASMPAAEEYVGDPEAWKQLCQRDDIDLVYIATDWANHAKMGVYAMEQGKHVAIEVPAAMTMDEIWALINTSERTRKHCIQLENCVYDFFEITTLNMAQQGLFGEILHVEGAYIHNLDEYWSEYWNNWRLEYNAKARGDIYATHGIGPVCQVLDIHRGDRMKTLVAMDTKPANGPKIYKKVTGEECPTFAQGDHTMTMIRTEKGKTIHIQHDVLTPRPYSRMYQLTGTAGFANKYPVQGYCFHNEALPSDAAPELDNLDSHKFVPEEVKAALMEKYKHPIVKDIEEMAKKVGGHGGMDYIMDYRLVYCLQNGLPLDMDVYDLAEWCCLAELGEVSITHNSAPVEVPDFTRGGWDKIDGYRHAMK